MGKRLEINYTKLWLIWAKKVPICNCGCGLPIVITYQSFRRNLLINGKPPIYIYTHFPKKYWKEYTKWLKSKPRCACGCKTQLKLKYDSFIRYFREFGQSPKFYRDHVKFYKIPILKEKNLSITKEIKQIPLLTKPNDLCEIEQAARGRCKRYIECPIVLSKKCLDKAIEKKWMGWRSKKYG